MVSLQVVPKAGVPADAKRPYYIGNTSVYLTGYKGEEPTDSIVFPGMTLHYSGKKPGIRPGVLAKRFFYQKGQLYSQARQNFTQEAWRVWAFSNLPSSAMPRKIHCRGVIR